MALENKTLVNLFGFTLPSNALLHVDGREQLLCYYLFLGQRLHNGSGIPELPEQTC